MQRAALSGVVLALVSGCAIGQKIEYRGVSDFRVGYSMRPDLRLGVVDHRDVTPDNDDWVGVQKSGLGIPYPVGTTSGRALSTDLGELLAASLNRRFNVKQVLVRTGTEDRAARSQINPEAEGAGILITLRKWETSTLMTMMFTYDVGLEVFDAKGTTLAFTSQAGAETFVEENLKRPTLAAAVSSIFADLFNNEDVRRALEAPAAVPTAAPSGAAADAPAEVSAPAVGARRPLKEGLPPPPAPQPIAAPPPAAPAPPPAAVVRTPAKAEKPGPEKTKCSVDQILKMKEMKFTDGQIKAACE